MIKIELLDAFEVYRTRPPIIMHENSKNRKKNNAFIVLAPSIEEELAFLSSSKELLFRNLYKYFIDKRWEHTLYGNGRVIMKPDNNDEVSALIRKYSKGNLAKIDGVTSYLPTVSSKVLKDQNVLVEFNHAVDAILHNPKDKRLVSYRAQEIADELIKFYERITPEGNYLGNYKYHLLIPMKLWFTKEDYSSTSNIFKTATRNFMGKLLQILSSDKYLSKLQDIYLVDGSVVLKIDYRDIPSGTENVSEFVIDCITKFIIKARKNPMDDKNTDDVSKKLAAAEKETEKEIAADSILTQAKVDPDKATPETREKVKTVVEKNIDKPKFVPKPTEEKLADTEDDPTAEPSVSDIPEPPAEETLDIEGVRVQDPEDVDVLLAAKMEGQSVQSYKRNEMLKTKYKELRMGDVPLTDIVKDEEKYAIPEIKPQTKTINEGMKTIKSSKFDKAYNENLAQRDLANILLHFSHVKPAMYLNKDIAVEDASTPTDRLLRYTVEFEDENRKRHKFSFLLPKMYKDKYLYLNDQEMNLLHQKLPYPVTKIGPDSCQAVTNYKKIISERYGSNLSPRITRIKKLFGGPSCPKIASVERGDATKLNHIYLTTIEYDEIADSLLRITMAKNVSDMTKIYFVVEEAMAVIDMKKVPAPADEKVEALIPLAMRKTREGTTNYYLSGVTNRVYDDSAQPHGELSDFIVEMASLYDPKIQESFADVSAGTKFVYTRSKILGEWIPLVIVLGAADPNGLISVLEKAKINYQFVTSRPHVEDKDKQGVIAFADGWLVFDRYPYENSLLLNGLATFPTKEYNFYDMGTRDTYVDILDSMFGKRTLIDGLGNFYYTFVDPITADVLIRLGMPTDFTRLMLYCNDVLADNTYQIDSDYHNSRIRSNEIIYAHLYRFLAEAWGTYRTGRAEKFSIREDCVIKELLTSNIVDPHSELNIILETENDRQVKLKGPSGMNEDHSFTIEKRAYHPSMTGIIGMNSTPSGEVGINRHLTLNPNIDDARGFITIEKGDYDGTELATPGELMQAFGPESADIERVAMGISQSKHIVPTASGASCPVSYDMERTIPYLSNDYAFVAKDDGKVVAIENDVMVIQYKDGTCDDVDLAERPAKNTDGGFFIMNKLDTKLKVGSKVTKGQLVAYDKKYINDHDMFGDPLATMGTMARVAVETNGGVYEDACYITDDLAHRMATKITKQKRVILSRFANIKYMAKIGQSIKANDPILTFDDTADEFSSQLLAQMAEEAGDDDEIIATSAPVISKLTGIIRDIRIYYTIPLDQMTPSMKKIVSDYNKEVSKREKTIGQYKSINDANTIVKTSQQLTPDSTGKVKGVKVSDGIFIDFYIEYEDIMAPGDKLSFYSPLKGIVSDIIPTEQAAYTESNPERKIDATLSAIGVYRRMCLDFIKVGGLCKIVVEKKRILKDKYADRVKAELKKK